MSARDIRHFGDPVLITPAAPVIDFDKELDPVNAMLDQIMRKSMNGFHPRRPK